MQPLYHLHQIITYARIYLAVCVPVGRPDGDDILPIVPGLRTLGFKIGDEDCNLLDLHKRGRTPTKTLGITGLYIKPVARRDSGVRATGRSQPIEMSVMVALWHSRGTPL